MPTPAATANVEVVADLARFGRELETGVRNAFNGVERQAASTGEDIERSMEEAGRSSGRALDTAARSGSTAMGRLSTGFGGLGRLAVTTGATMAGAFAFNAVIEESSNLSESLNAVNVTFGESSDAVLELGRNAATSVGLSRSEFNSLAVQFSSVARTVAGSGGDVVGVLDDMTRRSADFASVMNLDVNEATALFQSGLAGETEGLRRFGIDLSASAVEAYAMANGIGTVGEELTEAEKVQARYGLLMEQTNATQGDFANTSDGLANAMRIMQAELGNLAAGIGEAFLPILAELVPVLTDVAKQFADSLAPILPDIAELFGMLGEALIGLLPSFIELIGALLPAIISLLEMILPVILPVVDAVVSFIAALPPPILQAIAAALAILWAVGFGPIGLVIAAVVGLAVVITKNFDTIKSAIGTAMEFVRNIVSTVWDAVKGFFQTAVTTIKTTVSGAFDAVKTKISDVMTSIKTTVSGIIESVKGFFVDMGEKVKSAVSTAFEAAKNFAKDKIDLLIGFVSGIPQRVVTALGTLLSTVKTALGNAFEAGKTRVKEIIDGIIDFVVNLPTRAASAISGFASSVAGTVVNAVKGAINSVIDTVNGIVEFTIDVPDWIPGPDEFHINPPNIPHLAMGGVFRGQPGGFQATVAEAGDEAIIPIERPRRALDLLDASGLTDLVRKRDGGALISFPNAVIQDATDVDLVAQRTLAALTLRSVA